MTMACESCGHTVQNIGGGDESRRVFWCPRCGSLKTITGAAGAQPFVKSEAPKLVERARRLLHENSPVNRDAVRESVGTFACGRLGI